MEEVNSNKEEILVFNKSLSISLLLHLYKASLLA